MSLMSPSGAVPARKSRPLAVPSEFERWTDVQVGAALEAGAVDFPTPVITLGSVYPPAVLASLRRLAEAGRVSDALAAKFLAEAMVPAIRNVPLPHQRFLPVPHPLDYDWRFADSAVDYLLSEHGLERSDTKLLCLGACPCNAPRPWGWGSTLVE